MIALDPNHLMMIEPASRKKEAPINDELTMMAREIFAASMPTCRYRGFHVCACGEFSDNADWETIGGLVTNSLLAHYLREHRTEAPPEELRKLRNEFAKIGKCCKENF